MKQLLSPNADVNWCSKEAVLDYYESFEHWNTYISGYHKDFMVFSGILSVVDGLILHDGEYYLPAPIWINDRWNHKNVVPDGEYNITLLKQENSWYARKDNQGNIILNLAVIGSKTVGSVKELTTNNTDLYAEHCGSDISFRYDASYRSGISFQLYGLDPIKLFRRYYVRWRDDERIEISDDEIAVIMNPISESIYDIVDDAIRNQNFDIVICEEWGEVNVSDHLTFNPNISKRVFDIINKRISQL